MKNSMRLIGMCVAGVFATSGVALAEKPPWAGGGKSGQKEERRGPGQFHFNDESRRVIADYYGTQQLAGRCPPGLAKKNNGCQPPGQAKKWAKGKALPPGLAYDDLPYDLLRRLPPPPPRHRYVQIAGDILLIAIGTRMVIDAVDDLLR
jgi:Ni/Co efflux regulator RcnB